MKKSVFLVLICVIAVSLTTFNKTVCADEESAFDMFFNSTASLCYEELFTGILSCAGPVFGCHNVGVPPISIMAYLERHEKSPPFTCAILLTA